MKRKSREVSQDSVPPIFAAESADPRPSSASSSSEHRIPISIGYGGISDPNDFKFIQSVNIIHGYNVNLGENSPSNSRK
jgi:hypothetical protein